MTRRRAFLGGGLVALIGAGAAVWRRVPVIPARPAPDAATALGWIARQDGRFVLTLPRIEKGQNIATALRQVACAKLRVAPWAVEVWPHDTAMARLKATAGSETVQLFAEPLAQACVALRDALAAGRTGGMVTVTPRPLSDLRAFPKGGLIGPSPTLVQGAQIVTGAPLYAADIRLPGMLYGHVLHGLRRSSGLRTPFVGGKRRLWPSQASPGSSPIAGGLSGSRCRSCCWPPAPWHWTQWHRRWRLSGTSRTARNRT